MTKMKTWEERKAHREALKKLPLTKEEKARWAPMLHETWNAIAYDAMEASQGMKLTKGLITEYVCDANRVQTFGGMTDEEYAFLCVVWSRPSGKRWLYSELNY